MALQKYEYRVGEEAETEAAINFVTSLGQPARCSYLLGYARNECATHRFLTVSVPFWKQFAQDEMCLVR
jgi:hypothetical protein